MKKLAVLFAAMLAVAFTAPAFAADNLELSGEFRVRGWDVKDAGYTDDDDRSWFDQRMRIQATIKASDNAFVVVRTDVAEGTWGRNFTDRGGSWYRPTAGTDDTIQIDRAFGYYGQDNWGVTMGLQYLGLGILEVVDAQYTGAKLDLKFGFINPTFFYGKLEEDKNRLVRTGASTNDDNFDDTDLFALNLNFNISGFDTNVFGGYVNEYVLRYTAAAALHNVEVDKAWAIGLYTAGKLGMVNLVGEMAFFGGDADDTNTAAGTTADLDIAGTQFYLKGDADINDRVNLGAEFLWADGADDDEAQITNLMSDAGDFTIADTNAPSATDVVIYRANNITGIGSPFDFTGEMAGVLGGSLFGSYKVMDKLTLGAKIAYFTPEEEDNTDVDDLASYSVWAGYDLGSNTSLVLLYNIADMDSDDATEDESTNTLYARFMINF